MNGSGASVVRVPQHGRRRAAAPPPHRPMTVVLLRLPDGTSIESDLQGHDPSGEHHYVALRDGVQLRAFTTIAEVAQFINAVLDADATRGGAPT